MTDMSKYKNVSLSKEAYKVLEALSKVILPDAKLSVAKTIEAIANEKARKLNGKIKNKSDCRTISYFGDGACEEGIFHESLNLAGLYELPILFICENNMYSCNTHLRRRQTSNKMSRFAKSHNIKYEEIKFNEDLDSLIEKIENAFDISCKEPYFLEINSYRLYEHCGDKEDTSNGDRDDKEFSFFKAQDRVNNWINTEPKVSKSFIKSYKECLNKCQELSELSHKLRKI